MANHQPVRLAYNTFEPVSGVDPSSAPILFLHGLTSAKEHWLDLPQNTANATKRKVYALDARNHGESEWSDYFTFDVNVDDILHFMDVNGIRRAILVGHSMGGITAIRAALRSPERIERIVVEDMFVRKFSKEVANTFVACVSAVRQVIETLPANVDETEAKLTVFKSFFSNLPPDMIKSTKGKDMKENMLNFLKLRRDEEGRYQFNANLDVIEKSMKNNKMVTYEPSGIYDGPALFIYGKISPFSVGAEENHIKKFFPNAVLEGVEDAGHAVHFENMGKFMDTVLKFLS